MTKKFSVNLTDEEHAELEEKAKAEGKTMKEVLFESLKRGTLQNGVRIDEGGEPSELPPGHHKPTEPESASPFVLGAVKSAHSAFGGFDWEKAALSIGDWKNLSKPDIGVFLGCLKRENEKRDREPEKVLNQLGAVAEMMHTSLVTVKDAYGRTRWYEDDDRILHVELV